MEKEILIIIMIIVKKLYIDIEQKYVRKKFEHNDNKII